MTALHPRRLLLDVNVWVALFDSNHVHHDKAFALVTTTGVQIATCAITESGAIRLGALPALRTGPSMTHGQVRQTLQRITRNTDHAYWACSQSMVTDDLIDWDRVSGHRQVTDVYLLALAVAHDGSLASFDQRITLSAVKGAKAHHYVLL